MTRSSIHLPTLFLRALVIPLHDVILCSLDEFWNTARSPHNLHRAADSGPLGRATFQKCTHPDDKEHNSYNTL